MADELADIVDEHDRVVGRASRREIRARNLLHRGVGILCRDGQRRVYVHRRTDSKDLFPGLYDMFVGGMLAAGESYEDGARRELAEELGVVGADPVFLFKGRYDGADNRVWTSIFEVTWDGPLHVQAEEIAWGAFVPERELLRKLAVLPFAPDSLELFRRYVSFRGA